MRGVGAGGMGVVGGCAGESCCEVGEAQLVHGVPNRNVGGCGLAGTVVVLGGAVWVTNDDGGRQEGETAVCQAQGVQEILGFPPQIRRA